MLAKQAFLPLESLHQPKNLLKFIFYYPESFDIIHGYDEFMYYLSWVIDWTDVT
jgi:hypothetical protein